MIVEIIKKNLEGSDMNESKGENVRIKKLIESTKKHEGRVTIDGKHVVYDDATSLPIDKGDEVKGKPTAAYGRNLSDRGLTEDEAEYLLRNDLRDFQDRCKKTFNSFWDLLDAPRKNVLVEMSFNMGVAGVRSFSSMLEALEKSNYKRAAEEMLDSKWADQVGHRAKVLAKQMRTGEYQE